MSFPTPPPPRRGSSWPLLLLLLIPGGAVIVVLLGVIAWWVIGIGMPSQDLPEQAGPAYRVEDVYQNEVAWSVPGGADATVERMGWLAGDTLVYAEMRSARITALATADGSPRWTYRVPGPEPAAGRDRICAASRNTVDGAVAISYERVRGKYADCSGLMLLDLRTGKPRWNVTRAFKAIPEVALVAGLVVVADLDLEAFDPRTGARRWFHSERGLGCRASHVAGSAKKAVVVAWCGKGAWFEAWTLNPATGRPATRTRVVDGDDDPVIVSTDPLVLQGSGDWQTIWAMSSDGRRNTFRLPHPTTAHWPTRPAYLGVSGNRLVTQVRGRLGAWDIWTGRQLWQHGALAPDGTPTDRTSSHPIIAMVGSSTVLCLVHAVDGYGVLQVSLDTGELTLLGPKSYSMPYTMVNPPWVFWSGGRLYGVNPGGTEAAAFAVE